ncbi:MAG: divergent polysaccharide deacetylase family protein [Candidatus Cloacimonetes bacterium]|nr:divergent polysaccharide deacetylase family protein [Candidatus Cloacimonadota bacterium]MDD4155196.1 divergent polysaccharide deacetylase family protein [Candidatus Cloacimonadota bacterium]
MAKKSTKTKTKKKKHNKVSSLSLSMLIISFICITIVVIYFIFQYKNIDEFKLKPIDISSDKKETRTPEIDSQVKEKVIELVESAEATIETDTQVDVIEETKTSVDEEIVISEPIIRDKAKMYVVNPNLPKICIIIDDFGTITNTLFDRFNSLDTEVNFAILPGHEKSRIQMNKAVEAGREVLIHIPMEPDIQDNSDKKLNLETITINSSMTDFEIKDQIETWMFELFLAGGANNHMGSKATSDERIMKIVLGTLMQNDMYFVDSYTNSKSVVSKVANEIGIKTIKRDIFLDVPESSKANARKKIEEIKKIKNQDVVVVITHCHSDIKYRQLIHFIDRLKDQGYRLIPASSITLSNL